MNEEQVLDRLRRMCARSSAAEVGRGFGFSRQYMCDILNGRRRMPDAILAHFGLERETWERYAKVEK